jgi:serine/threonine protein kinase
MTAPTRIGRYEIVSRLGKSMTDVYLAIDTVENRKTALKLIHSGDDAATRLILEAERRGAAIQKELHHLDPRMVEIYEYGDTDGYFFVAMQFVEGRNLAEVLSSDQVIDPYRAAVISLEICEQLAKFHSWQSAVVHGDIKPSNIHLGHNDTVRLLDFGIAKILRADCNATNHNFGSPSYCSPERLARAQVDQQSDLWALGATLYEMLAGVPPYQAENTRKLESLIRSKRPPRALPAACPAGLRAIVTKALAPDPAHRYRSALEFQADLQSFLERKPTIAETERRSRWSPGSTLEAAREALRKVTRTAARRRPARRLQVAGAIAYFAAGMLLWIGGTLGWQAWQARASAAASPPTSPATSPPTTGENVAQLYVATADRILDSYRYSVDPWLYDFDWQKAEICLERAVALGSGEDSTLGKLALSRGYATLERLNGAQYSDNAAAQLRIRARDEFMIAARKLPADPAPHLALARVYVYSLPDPEKAMAEFAAAERLGASLGRREIEQQGDVYRIRAQRPLPASSRQAVRDAVVRDAATARAFYQRIPGFDEVDDHLRELDRIHAPAARKTKAGRYYRWR